MHLKSKTMQKNCCCCTLADMLFEKMEKIFGKMENGNDIYLATMLTKVSLLSDNDGIEEDRGAQEV